MYDYTCMTTRAGIDVVQLYIIDMRIDTCILYSDTTCVRLHMLIIPYMLIIL